MSASTQLTVSTPPLTHRVYTRPSGVECGRLAYDSISFCKALGNMLLSLEEATKAWSCFLVEFCHLMCARMVARFCNYPMRYWLQVSNHCTTTARLRPKSALWIRSAGRLSGASNLQNTNSTTLLWLTPFFTLLDGNTGKHNKAPMYPLLACA